MDEKDFSKHIRKAKFKNNLKTVCIVLLVLIVLSGVFIFFNINNVIIDSLPNERDSFYTFNHLCGPNLYLGKETRSRRFLAEKHSISLFKLIEGIPVFSGEKEFHRGLNFDEYTRQGTESPLLFGDSWNESDTKKYRYDIYGNREMVFYYPCINYSYYRDDMKHLDKISSDKYIEMAISFDNYYSIEEVQKMIPKDITISWYWVDTDSEEEKKGFNVEHKEVTVDDEGKEIIKDRYYDPEVCSEHIAYGIKAFDSDGSEFEHVKPEEMFIAVLERQHNNNYIFDKYRYEMKRIYNNLLGEDGKLTSSDLKIQGIVVNGDKEKLKGLEELDFIKATSIGVTVDKY